MSNTKRMWIRILCLAFVLFSFFALSSCDETDANVECEHTWGDWTVITEASCEESGERQRVCSECKETEKEAIKALSHEYGEWSVTKAATCTEEGEEKRVCAHDSEHYETRKVEKIAHTFDVEKEDAAYLKSEGSCTEKAVYYKSCKCGEKGSETFETGTPAHTYDKEVVDAKYLKSEATCTAKAVYYKSCECGAFDAEKSATFESGATKAHTYDKSVAEDKYLKSEATCTEKAVYYKSCECGAFDVLVSETFQSGTTVPHTYDRTVAEAKYLKSEATCTAKAVYYKSCECGAFDETLSGVFEYGDKKEHVYDKTVADSKFIKTPASCTEVAVYYKSCVCGEKGSDTFQSGTTLPHNYDRRVVDAKYLKSEATCTEKAVYYKSCKCGAFDIALSDTFQNGDTLPHVYDREIVDAKYLKSEATCTEKAVYYKSCKCGHKGSSATFESGELLAHIYGEEVVADKYLKSEATCTEKAVYYKSCKCGAFDTALSATFEAGELLAHTYDKEIVADKYLKSEATCTKAAVYYKSCKCGAFDAYESETFESGAPIAHTYDKDVVADKYLASEATCTDKATYYKSCKCGAFDAELSATFENGELLAHVYDKEIVDAKYLAAAATCETRTLYYKSCKCGAHDNEKSGTFEYGELAGHNHVQISFTAASCTVDGLKVEECTVCGDKIETTITAEGHNYVDTVIEPKCTVGGYTEHKCSKCGDTYTDNAVKATGHLVFDDTVVPATCEEDGYTEHKCRACGYIEKIDPTTKLGHDYKEEVVEDSSCTKTGTKKITCSRCDYESEEIIATKSHIYSNIVTTPATCTSDGYTTYTCTCGVFYTVEGETAKGHKWSTTIVEPKCTEQGYTHYDCDNCDAEEDKDWVAATGHSWDIDAPTCGRGQKCTVCYADGAAATGNHVYDSGSVVDKPSCTEKGVMKYTCTNGDCDHSYTEEISETGHNTEGAEWVKDSEKCTDGKCTYVNIEKTTCLNGGCGETVTRESAPYEKHNYQATITQAATCTVPGIKTYTCTVCGGQPAENATVEYSEASGHNWEETASTETTKSYECSACHETKTVVHSDGNSANVGAGDLGASGGVNLGGTEIEIDEATKSQLGEEIEEKGDLTISINKIEGADRESIAGDKLDYIGDAPIYDLNMLLGGDENNKVSNFAGKVTVRIPYKLDTGEDPENLTIWYIDDEGNVSTIKGATYVVIGDQGYAVFETDHFSYYTVTKLTPEERCERDGHVEKTIKQEANCLVGGYEKVICTRCGKVLSETYTEALGHNWSEKVTAEATCDTAGIVEHSCDRCKLVYYTAKAAYGHKWSENKTVEATCAEAGYILYVCDNDETHTYKVVIPKANHSYVPVVTAPTCTTKGYTTNTCSECGISYVSDIVAAKGHKIVKTDVPATCISAGYTAQSCEICGQNFKNINETPMTGHSWNIDAPTCSDAQICTVCNFVGAAATGEHNMTEKGECSECGKACEHSFYVGETHAPTCVENGYTEYICSFCKMVEQRDVIESGDHQWKAIEHKAPTCTEDGFDKYLCPNCGETRIETQPKGDGLHKETTKVVAPTCEEEGYTLRYCRTCGEELERTDIVEATGHSYEVIDKLDPTCDKGGYITVKCSGCGDEKTKTFEANGHNHELVETVQPTCDKAGAEIYKCTACDDSYEKEIPAKGHDHELVETVESTCVVNGKKIYKCTACGDTREEELPLASHNYVDGKCDVCGKEQSACDHVEPHEFERSYHFINKDSRNCEDGVEISFSCPKCEEVVFSMITTGHNYEHIDISELVFAGNVNVRRCTVCHEGDINAELNGCNLKSFEEKEYVDEDGYAHMVETAVCADCGLTVTCDVRIVENECDVSYEYTYTFSGAKLEEEISIEVVNFVESHDYTTDYEEIVDEENLIFTEVGIRRCEKCGKITSRFTETIKYIEKDIPYEYIETVEIALDDKGTEFVICEEEYQRAEYNIIDGEYVPVEIIERETTFNSKGEPMEVEEAIEKYNENGDYTYFYAAYYNYICGEKLLVEYEEEEYVTITLPGGYEKNLIASNKYGEYDIHGELVDSYEETFTYEIIEGESCKIKVTCTNSEGETETSVEDVHVNVERYHEFANGATSCDQGVYIIEKCTVCGEEIRRDYRTYHSTTVTEDGDIDASELGCECGGYISIQKCLYCDYENVYYHFNCQFDEYDTEGPSDNEEWGEVIVPGGGEVVIKPVAPGGSYDEIVDSKPEYDYDVDIDGDGDIDYDDGWGEIVGGNSFKDEKTCSKCGFSYTIEWYSEKGEDCQTVTHYTYSFGKDAEGNPIKVVETNQISYSHRYTHESNVIEDTYEAQPDGSIWFRRVIENKMYCVTCGHITNHSFTTQKRDDAGFILYEESVYLGYNGDESYERERTMRIFERYTMPDGGTNARIVSEEIYRYNNNGDVEYFEKRTYTYSEDNPCITIIDYENSYGETDRFEEDNHDWSRQYVLVEGATSCEEGVRIIRVCNKCGAEIDDGEIINWHNSESEHIDLSKYGSTCGAYLEINSCACGQNSYVYFERAGGHFKSQYGTYTDENGNVHRVERGECMADGFWYEIDRCDVKGDGCHVTEYVVYRFGNSTTAATLLERSTVREREAHAYVYELIKDEMTQETDAEGNVLNIHEHEGRSVCDACGNISNHEYSLVKMDAFGNTVYEIFKHFGIDEKGNEYVCNSDEVQYKTVELANGKTISVTLFEISNEYNVSGDVIWNRTATYEYHNGYCEYTAHVVTSDGEEWYDEGKGHREVEQVLTLVPGATSCDQGVIVAEVCLACGEEFNSYTEYWHITTSEWIDLSEYGCKCGGELHYYSCACGMDSYASVNGGCSFEKTSSTVTDENGFKHRVTTHVCMNCSFKYSIETWSEMDEYCHRYSYTVYNIGIDAEGNAAFTKTIKKDNGTSHKIIDEGGETIESTETDELGNVFTVYTTENKTYCGICGTVEHHTVVVEKLDSNGNLAYRSDTSYSFADGAEYVSSFSETYYMTVILEDGRSKLLELKNSHYKYESDGSILDFVIWEFTYDNGDYCHATVTRTDVEGVYTDKIELHGEFEYEVSLEEGAVHCTDGIIVKETCLDCGEVVNNETRYEHFMLDEHIELSEYGSECGDYFHISNCPCGMYNKWDMGHICSYKLVDSSYEGDKFFEHSYESYVCTNCGFEYAIEIWVELDENCIGTKFFKFTFGKNGEILLEKLIKENMGETHTYNQKRNEVESTETDEYGNILKVITVEEIDYCTNCNENFYRNVLVGKMFENDLPVSSEENTYRYVDGVETLERKTIVTYNTVVKPNGEPFTYEVTRKEYNADKDYWRIYEYSYKDDNYCIVYVKETTPSGKINEYTREEHGNVVTKGELMPGATSCDQGIIISETCLDCGMKFNSYETYGHHYIYEEIDASTLGSKCGGTISINYCPCGQIFEVMNYTGCIFTETSDKVEQEDGTVRAVRNFTCESCGFTYTYSSWTDNTNPCHRYNCKVYTFGKNENGEPILVKEIRIDRGESHKFASESNSTESTETDESGRTLKVITTESLEHCMNCGLVNIRRVIVEKFDENGNAVYREECGYRVSEEFEFLETKTVSTYASRVKDDGSTFNYEATREVFYYDENGNNHYWEKYEYSYQDDNPCARHIKYTDSNGYINEYYEESHGLRITKAELMDGATSCEQGIIILDVCEDCGTEFSRREEYYHHNMEIEIIDISELSACGGSMIVRGCPCGFQVTITNRSNCKFVSTNERVQQEDGTYHSVSTYVCESCGFTYTYENWTENTTCYNYQYRVYRFGIDENGKAAVEREFKINRGENHKFSDVKEEVVETTEKDDAGNDIRVVTRTQTVECDTCGKINSMTVYVEKYADINGQSLLVYSETDYYALSTNVEGGIYLERKQIFTYGYVASENGTQEMLLLLELFEVYDIYGEKIDFQQYEHIYADGDYCHRTVIYTNFYGERNEEHREEHVSLETRYELSAGSENCEDGLDRVTYCPFCKKETYRAEKDIAYHYCGETPSSVISLGELGSTCGGEFRIFTCLCGEREDAQLYTDCIFNHSGYYYTYKAEDGSVCEPTIMTCPVTDPELCGFSYAHIVWETSDENCMGIYHVLYVLGIDLTTMEAEYTYYRTYSAGYYNHNLVHQENSYTTEDGKQVTESKGVCSNCGLVGHETIDTRYTDANGDNVHERDEIQYEINTNVQIQNSRHYYIDITRDVIFSDGTSRNVNIFDRRETYYSDDISSWSEQSYEYDSDTYCSGTRLERSYDQWRGELSNSYYFTNHEMSVENVISESTCTQRGLSIIECAYCEYSEERDTHETGHFYEHDYEKGLWICRECGLENFTGADGEVIFEDLTSRRGDGTQYVVGYRNYFGSEYIFSLFLVIGEEEYPIELEVIDDGNSLVYIDVAAVRELAKTMGYDTCGYMLCVRFVPIGDYAGYYYDFAITLDPHVYVLDERNCVNPDDPCVEETVIAYKCIFCGDKYTESYTEGHDTEWVSHSLGECGSAINYEICKKCDRVVTTVRDQSYCSFECSCSSETDENGIVHNFDTFVCAKCGATYKDEYYTVVGDNCTATSYSTVYWGIREDGSYEFSATVVDVINDYHTLVTEENVTEEEGKRITDNVTRCFVCGKIQGRRTETICYDDNGNVISDDILNIHDDGSSAKEYYEYIFFENGSSNTLLNRRESFDASGKLITLNLTKYEYNSEGKMLARETETVNSTNTTSKNRYEYFYTEDGRRYESSRVYETMRDGELLKSYTMVYEYDFEAGIRTWTRTHFDGSIENGEEPIK